jgi:S1-C subfamily serine protease
MATDLLTTFSNQLADAVSAASPSVVQVQGRRRPASGLVYADNVVLTTVRALGREDGLHVRRNDGATLDAELAGWDPTTSLAVLRVAGLETARSRHRLWPRASAISRSPSRGRGATSSPLAQESSRSSVGRCRPGRDAPSSR